MGLMRLLRFLRAQDLPQWRLVAGCIYQTVWNVLAGLPAGTGIKDYDVIYFDDRDRSFAGEDLIIKRLGDLHSKAQPPLPEPIEIRNQARVHLWFEESFGASYPKLRSSDESLLYYSAKVHAVGVRLDSNDALNIICPFGLADMFDMVIRPNRTIANATSYAIKAERALSIWPMLKVIPWQEAQA